MTFNLAEAESQLRRARSDLREALQLLSRCYRAGHREGWENDWTNAEVFEAVNAFMHNQTGDAAWMKNPDWL